MEDGHAGNQLALLGLSAVLLGPKLLPTLARASRPVAKQLVKSGHSYRPRMTLTEWIKQSQGNNLDAGR
ncbi:hypothetical protein S7335_2958 [Synechococcus sp. PCC 7335]|nr:hypothetical protein S7335_2958 [Synechococcus sp. PCC 7335]